MPDLPPLLHHQNEAAARLGVSRDTMRGFAAVALCNPKTGENVGGAMRACGVYGASLIIVAGPRYKRFRDHPTDTMRAWRHIPVLEAADPLDCLPHDCVPVAVEIAPTARPLPRYQHPERALYVFGPEDGSVPPRVIARCRDLIMIPCHACMNLAATVNVVLYDRTAKRGLNQRAPAA